MTPEELAAKNAEATRAIAETPCPGCGMEPEVRTYWRDKATKVRCGYHCTCGASVIRGMMVGSML